SDQVVRATLPAAHAVHGIRFLEAPAGDARHFAAVDGDLSAPVGGFFVLESEGDAEDVSRWLRLLARSGNGDHQDDGDNGDGGTTDTRGHGETPSAAKRRRAAHRNLIRTPDDRQCNRLLGGWSAAGKFIQFRENLIERRRVENSQPMQAAALVENTHLK